MCLKHVLRCSKHFVGPTLSSMMYSLQNTDKKQKNVHFFCPLCPLFFVHFANLAVPWTKWTWGPPLEGTRVGTDTEICEIYILLATIYPQEKSLATYWPHHYIENPPLYLGAT